MERARTNEKNELILTKMVIGRRICMNYGCATKKDYLSLLFVDKMLDHLAWMDIQSYNQIINVREDDIHMSTWNLLDYTVP